MALPLTTLLKSVDDKAAELMEIHRQLHNRISELEEENSNLRKELEDARKELTAARNDAEFLTMSHRLADSPDTLISARRRIARLIRNIDTCISMLKEE